MVEPWFIYHGTRLYHGKWYTVVVPLLSDHGLFIMNNVVEPWYDNHATNPVWVLGLRIDPLRLISWPDVIRGD